MGALIGIGALIKKKKKHIRRRALIRKGALIGRRALNRIITIAGQPLIISNLFSFSFFFSFFLILTNHYNFTKITQQNHALHTYTLQTTYCYTI